MDTTMFELSLEQQFQMRLMQESAQELSREQMLDVLMQTSRMLMVKDNIIRNLVKNGTL
ncbi:photosystem I reaction center subunit XII [Dulcicalothrix desertica PCC 7102]|uniref:Photosystem I reaction center subunit XII n=1 Tax=Dulcicalothrix desertica PCC 7102 TaxID=232991 RepID=A0A3S1IHJ9_9CYAN|nr:NblA/ycf18 family protein [Dulcicalothrix desertica]RUS97472.1 photosystem I reaction center subunit XII [Dulcicalothrix desertica PCC 7102]TWH62072.1 phycobilisome degradation protein nblA [Dulcicalothrix desertica PCC 7102]